jgi:hypothetical protein
MREIPQLLKIAPTPVGQSAGSFSNVCPVLHALGLEAD